MSRLSFKLIKKDSQSHARIGHFRTPRGEVQTPVFMPVGTRATIRAQTPATIAESGATIMLANTYHLMVSPGKEVFDKIGGVHKFMNWSKPVLTDSGGFQIFSLQGSRKMKEEGADFQNYLNGDRIFLTPEKSIEMQTSIGSDIMMVLDQCIPSTASLEESKAAMELTHRWAVRSLRARSSDHQALFGIVQGACYTDLRRQSAEFLSGHGFDGFAIGGLAVGETKSEREDITEFTAPLLPENLPRYLMGVGTPIDLLEAVHRGVDMFDCIIPTAFGQQGIAFTSLGKINLKRVGYKFSEEKLDPACKCTTCAHYSRAYLHHLVKSKEVLGWHLVGAHNLYFYSQLMSEIRSAIREDRFGAFYQKKRIELSVTDGSGEAPPKEKSKKRRPLFLGDFEIALSKEGFARIRQKSSGEIMHPVSDPSYEVEKVYIEQSNFKTECVKRDLVVWDVGLGAAHNSMRAIHLQEELADSKELRLFSFENDLDSLRLALMHPANFHHVRHAAPTALVQTKQWIKGKVNWQLMDGDFFEKMSEAARPDLIFYDPFSFRTDSHLWSLKCFQKLADICAQNTGWVGLYTYSNSTAARAALLASGFHVARGVATGPKTETTIAVWNAKDCPHAYEWLGPEFLSKWKVSGAKYPRDLDSAHFKSFEEKLLTHPQFKADS